MDYQITKATPEIGQIEVTYFNEGKPIANYAIDVPIVDGAYLTGDALDAEIQHRAPIWLVQREQETKTAEGFDAIQNLVKPLNTTPPEQTAEEIANAKMWADFEFNKKVAKALVKFGVLQTDPTEIGVTQL